MEITLYCASFVPILLLSLHSSRGQLIYPNDDKEYAVELKSCTTRLRQNEILGNMNLKDEVGAIKREVKSVKMQIESFRCFIPGLHEPNTTDFIGARTGGESFNDCRSWKERDITAVRLGCSTLFLFYIQLKYGDTWAAQHGLKDGCDPESYGVLSIQNVTYDLDPSEYITSISGTSHPTHTYVQAITFRTNKRTLPRCGPEDGVKKTINGSHLLYISGRKGCVIDGIELHWLQ